MKSHYTILLVALLSVLFSCSKELEVEQHGVTSIENFYQTDEQVMQANAASYTAFIVNPSNMDFNFLEQFELYYIIINTLLSDEAYSAGGGSTTEMNINEFTFTTDNIAIQYYYAYMYAMINKANLVLDNTSDGQSAFVDMCRAEAKFFRSWANFELATLWGNAPNVDHVLQGDEYHVKNSEPGELWAQIEKDLTEAIQSGDLSEKKSTDDNLTWRVTKQLAQALLGKAYLWQKKYAESAAQFDAVVSSGKYALLPTDDYENMWTNRNKFCCESIFEINRTFNMNNVNVGLPWRNFFWFTEVYNNLPPVVENTGSGFGAPKKSLYDAFVKHEGKNGKRLHQTLRTYSELNQEYGMRMMNGASSMQDSIFTWKTRLLPEHRGAYGYITTTGNMHIMRYAEVLLCGAEAHLMAGNGAKAAEYLNQVRRRAGLSDLGSVTLDDIKIEKRLELCYEGTRYKDLLRWGDAPTVLKNQGESVAYFSVKYATPDSEDPSTDILTVEYRSSHTDPNSYGFKTGKHEYLPYPSAEVRANPNIVQNPGY